MREKPYFMSNPEWYKEVSLEESDRGYVLTDKAPPEAVKSYNEYYNDIYTINGQDWIINF